MKGAGTFLARALAALAMLAATATASDELAGIPLFEDLHAGELLRLRVQEGKLLLEQLQAQAAAEVKAAKGTADRAPDGGPPAVADSCWGRAVRALTTTCAEAHADDTTKSRLALQLTNCHLAKSGRTTYPCAPGQSFRACTGGMDDAAFTVYSQFFTHSESTCFYLRSEQFQQRAQRTINDLHSSAALHARELRLLLDQVAHAREGLVELEMGVDNAMGGVLRELGEQREAVESALGRVAGGLSKLTGLQVALLRELFPFWAVAFYLGACALIFLLTSAQRTAAARARLYAALVATLLVERAAIALAGGDGHAGGGGDDDGAFLSLLAWLWPIRQAFATLGVVVLAHCWRTWEDLEARNHRLLLGIREVQQQQQLQLQPQPQRLQQPQGANKVVCDLVGDTGDTQPQQLKPQPQQLPQLQADDGLPPPSHECTIAAGDRAMIARMARYREKIRRFADGSGTHKNVQTVAKVFHIRANEKILTIVRKLCALANQHRTRRDAVIELKSWHLKREKWKLLRRKKNKSS